MGTNKILVLGDALEDVYYIAKQPSRRSAEAEIWIHDIEDVNMFPGGAANIVRSLEGLGFDCDFLYGVNAGLGVPQKCRIVVAETQTQVFRFDLNDKVDAIWKELLIPHLLRPYKAVVIADYGKGSIDRSVREAVIDYAQKFVVPLYVHTKDSPVLWWTLPNTSTTMFCNYKEWSKFENQYNIMTNVIRTEGSDGATLIVKGEAVKHVDALTKQVIDVNGAGDVFMATYIVRDIGTPLVQAHKPSALRFASVAAAKVVAKPYTSFIEWQELKEAWYEYNNNKTSTSK